MPSITLDLPYPVSVNLIWRSAKGKVYKSPEYINWINQAFLTWMIQKPKCSIRRIEGYYCLSIVVCPPDNRKRDLDNLIKVIQDFLQTDGIVENDSLCRDLRIRFGNHQEAPMGARLTIAPLSLPREGEQSHK